MKRILIIHGWGGSSKSHWFPWLKNELEKLGVKVYCPDLPNSDRPNLKEWLNAIRREVKTFDESLSIIGHSLGGTMILRLLEGLHKGEKINKVILVCGFFRNLIIGIKERKDFFKTDFDWKKIRKKANKFIVINSDNDPYLMKDEGRLLAENLNTELIVEHNAGHINSESGYLKYDMVLKMLIG